MNATPVLARGARCALGAALLLGGCSSSGADGRALGQALRARAPGRSDHAVVAQRPARPSTSSTCTTCARARAAPPACRGAVVAATSRRWRRCAASAASPRRACACSPGGAARRPARRPAAVGACRGADAARRQRRGDVPPVYNGGGVTAQGPALLVRKSVCRPGSRSPAPTTSTRSATPRSTSSPPPARTRRRATSSACRADYVYRDSLITPRRQHQPRARLQGPRAEHRHLAGGVRRHDHGLARLHARRRQGRQEGLARASSTMPSTGSYRLGVSQILTPRWIATPQRRGGVRRRLPRQPLPRRRWCSAPLCRSAIRARARAGRSSCASIGDLMLARRRCSASYRYFYDTWDIKGHTLELGCSRYCR